MSRGPGIRQRRLQAALETEPTRRFTMRRPSKTGSSPARYVGSSLIAVQAARARDTVKDGLSARPTWTAVLASSR